MSINGLNDYNIVYNNFFLSNGQHAYDGDTDSKWNTTTIGNYWDNHTVPDSSPQDGIVDTPYTYIGGPAGSIDYLPIAEDGAPSITIHSPSSGIPFGINAPTLIVEIIDTTPVEMWYSLDGGIHNYTFRYMEVYSYPHTAYAGVIDQSAWDALQDGSVTITFYARDIVGNTAFEAVSIIKDTGLDPGIITFIVIFIIGGIVFISVIVVILVKKNIITLEKIKGLSLKRK